MAADGGLKRFGLFVAGGSSPVRVWEASYFKPSDRDRIEIYRYEENAPTTGTLVAVVNLDKGSYLSEVAEGEDAPPVQVKVMIDR
jgi:hypothetical protein